MFHSSLAEPDGSSPKVARPYLGTEIRLMPKPLHVRREERHIRRRTWQAVLHKRNGEIREERTYAKDLERTPG